MSTTDTLCRSYLDLKWHFDPAAASVAGLASHDGKLGEYDGESMRRHLAAFRAVAAATEELDVDDTQEAIDRTALLNEIRSVVFRFEHERPEQRNPEFWLSHLFQGLYALVTRRPDDGEEPEARGARAGALAERLKAVPPFLDAARATLDAPASVFVDTALGMLGGGGELIARAAVTFAADAPELAAELNAATAEALASLTRFGAALANEIEPSADPHAFAIGEEQFTRRLHYEHAIAAGAPELWRYGLRAQEEIEAEITDVAARLDPGRPWREVVEDVRERGSPDGDLLSLYRCEVERARRFVSERDLVLVPDGAVEVTETPAFLRTLIPFAAYEPPPIYLAGRTGRFYVTVPDFAARTEDRARLLRDHAVYGLPSLVAHEAFPGHHLQLLSARETRSEVRRHLWTPLTVEGWALYCEELMGDEGYYRNDEERLLYLVHRLWRAARIVLDVGLHTRGMTPAEAVAELVGRIPMERRAAEAEVRRYCAWPTYQLCYEVGRRELRRLKDAYRARAGAGFRARHFHDELLSYGGLAVSLVEWGMGLD